MKYEIPVINSDSTVVEGRRHLIEQLRKEAAAGTVRVNLYRGPEEYGSEAFYTLSDGTVLHEVVATDETGEDYRILTLVVDEPQAGLLHRAWSG